MTGYLRSDWGSTLPPGANDGPARAVIALALVLLVFTCAAVLMWAR